MRIRTLLLEASVTAMVAAAGIAYAADLSSADKQFVMRAAKDDMTEAHEGQMAETQAQHAQVKDFAKTLVADRTEAYQELGVLAAKIGVTIPNGIDAGKDPTIRQLVHMKGASFDRQFSADEIAADRREIALFKREALHARDAGVKDYASKMLPTLEKDLRLAEACEKSGGRA